MFVGPSKIKTETINEIVREWVKAQPIVSHKQSKAFIKRMKFLGWKSLGKSWKIAIYKNSIVAKFGQVENSEVFSDIEHEVKQWFVAPKKFKKHLPRLYFYYHGMLVQDLVFNNGCNDTYCKVSKVAEKFRLQDYNHNHGHSLSGNIKFFDFVAPYDWLINSPSLVQCTKELLSPFNIDLGIN